MNASTPSLAASVPGNPAFDTIPERRRQAWRLARWRKEPQFAGQTSTREGGSSIMNAGVRWMGRTVLWGLAALLVLLPLAWVPLSLQLPLGRDQGIFAWVAEVVLGGGLPYADAWEIKGPVA